MKIGHVHIATEPPRKFVKVAVLFAMSILNFASFAENHAMKKEKHFGQVFTPKYLVQDILDVAGYSEKTNILEKHVIDNSCGDGAFLEEIVRRYAACFLSQKKDKRMLARHLFQYIHGIELDADAHTARCGRAPSRRTWRSISRCFAVTMPFRLTAKRIAGMRS